MAQHINIIGQIATEPKLFTPEGGVQFCTFRVACTERRFDTQKNTWVDADTNWFTANIFRTLAIHAKESFAKGDRVILSGRLRVRNWEKDEKRGTSVEIDVDGIGHDVRWGVSSFTKRAGGTQTQGSDDAMPVPTAKSVGAMANWVEPGEREPNGQPYTSPDADPDGYSADGFTPREAAA